MPDPRARGEHRPTRAEHVADQIRATITAGDLEPGQRLPTTTELVEQYSVAKNTVTRAIKILADEGRVQSFEGSGVFVLDPADAPLAQHIVSEGSGRLIEELMRRFDVMEKRLDAQEKALTELRQRASAPASPPSPSDH